MTILYGVILEKPSRINNSFVNAIGVTVRVYIWKVLGLGCVNLMDDIDGNLCFRLLARFLFLYISMAAVFDSDTFIQSVEIYDSTDSTSSVGSLMLYGGITIYTTANAISQTQGGGMTMLGGASISKDILLNGLLRNTNTTESTNASNGGIFTLGGLGVTKNLNVDGVASIGNTSFVSTTSANILNTNLTTTNLRLTNLTATNAWITIGSIGTLSAVNETVANSNITTLVSTTNTLGNTFINTTTNSTNTSTGALVIRGGVGIQGALNVYRDFNVSGAQTGGVGTQGQYIVIQPSTYTDNTTATGGTAPSMVFNSFARPTLQASNTGVYTTNAATVYIDGGPIAGTNETIGNSYALWINGNIKMNGIFENDSVTAYIRDEKTAGTNGGTFSSGAWRTRVINTITTNGGSFISLSSNQVTLTTGTYIIDAKAPHYSSTSNHAIRWQNITDATTDILGSNESANNQSTNSCLYDKITITSTKVFELQHRCQSSKSVDGLGRAHGYQTEVYATVFITKIV